MSKFLTLGIAVYNVETYLTGALESAMSLTGDDVEILAVNDGSTDRSGAILDEYAKKDARIRVIHKENGGVSTVRNRIIEEAQGEWIAYLDGDDRVSPGAMAQYREHADTRFDIVYFDAIFFRYEHSVAKYVVKAEPEAIDGDGIRTLALDTMYTVPNSRNYINKTLRSVWGKLFRTEFLRAHHIRFDARLPKSQDLAFNLRCLKDARSVKLVRRPVVLYRQNDESIVNRYSKKITQFNTALATALKELAEPFGSEMQNRYYLRCISDMGCCARLDMCHSLNPESAEARKAAFIALAKQPWCVDALAHADYNRLAPIDKAAYTAFKHSDFAAISAYYRKEDRKQSVKVFLNKTGLSKLLRFVRDSIKR